jgi:hypothetical protein
MLSHNLQSFVASCRVNITSSTRCITVDIDISCSRISSSTVVSGSIAAFSPLFTSRCGVVWRHWRLQCTDINVAYGTTKQ